MATLPLPEDNNTIRNDIAEEEPLIFMMDEGDLYERDLLKDYEHHHHRDHHHRDHHNYQATTKEQQQTQQPQLLQRFNTTSCGSGRGGEGDEYLYDLAKSHSHLSTTTERTVTTADDDTSIMMDDQEEMSFDDIEFFDEHTAAATEEAASTAAVATPNGGVDDGLVNNNKNNDGEMNMTASPSSVQEFDQTQHHYHHPYHHYGGYHPYPYAYQGAPQYHPSYYGHHNNNSNCSYYDYCGEEERLSSGYPGNNQQQQQQQQHHHNHHPRSASMAVTPTRRSSSGKNASSEKKNTQKQQKQRHSAFVFSGFANVTPTRRSSAPPAVPQAPTKKKAKDKKTPMKKPTKDNDRSSTGKPPKSSKKSAEGAAAEAAVAATSRSDSGLASGVDVPSKFDILCGQSRICASHTGNRRFQVVLDVYAPRYDVATSKQEKMTLTKEIVACIHTSGGRFLKYKDGLWEEISDVTARDKVSHALRTKVASWKRQQQEKASTKSSPCASIKAKKPSHRRSGSVQRSRRSSGSSVATNASDIVTTSFDGNDSSSANVMGELIKAQREIFATLTTSSSFSSGKTNEKNNGGAHPLKKTKS